MSSDKMRVYAKIWSFAEGNALTVEVTSPNKQDDNEESYIENVVENMIDNDMDSFRR